MTSAIICILVVLSVLLFVHLCVIVILLFNQRRSSAQVNVSHEGYLVVYASQSGHVEHYAKQFAHQLQQSGQLSAVLDLQYLSISELTAAKKILWCVSTCGEGDAPDTARAIAKKCLCNHWIYLHSNTQFWPLVIVVMRSFVHSGSVWING